ncbi:mitogen-activated protein kinase kinase kinase 20-like [Bidens hawaiensis]|uniref:mitogen-activated protein kinase kinase kinase 20-like n=1 Tax=Bidens hawaiensis TaxID=980011 RepID=UPI004049EB40
MESKKMKRRLFGGEHVHEGKKSKQEDWKKMYGDGVSWFRGAMIGKGSFGRVFVANVKSRYSLYPPIMAVKSADVSASGSIQKEKEVLDNIRGCSNVIRCFGEEVTIGDQGQMVYNLLLEYGSGGTLADLIKKSNGVGLPELDARRHARSILRGLSHVHKRGFVHCDLKPENVLLVAGKTGGFIAKIGDFGLAKRTKRAKKNSFGWGTPMYLSPEALINGVQEQPADIWAFGCIVFEMLTGKPLGFSDRDNLGVEEMLTLIVDEVDLLSFSSRISAEGKSFLKHCLCKKVMCRLTANMLLNHPFLKGLRNDDDDRIKEVGETREVYDINSITSSLLSFYDEEEDADELWLQSTCADENSSYEEDVHATPNEESMKARLHEVQRFPVRLVTIS